MKIEEVKMQLGCIRGLANIGLDKIYLNEQKAIPKKEMEEEVKACTRLLEMYLKDLKIMVGEGNKNE